MTMLRIGAAVLCLLASSYGAAAGTPPLVCFGNEPSWGVELTTPDTARVTLPGDEPMTFKGGATRNEVLGEWLWRGSPTTGRDLVVFLRDAVCSDGMSDTKHPYTARVSLPDRRFLAGCCRIPAPAGAASSPRRLEGASWRLTSLAGKGPQDLAALPRPATVRFESGRVSGFSGCNSFRGSYKVDGDRVTFGQLASTMMACTGPAMSFESAFGAALSSAIRYAIDGDQLQLTAASGVVLAFALEPAPRLDGIAWEVTGFNNDRHAVVGPHATSRITFSFAEGMVTGHAGCNAFRAPYSTQGARIKVGPAMTTRKSCTEELMVQERQFLTALESAVTWSIEGGTLDMHRADKERAIFATAGK